MAKLKKIVLKNNEQKLMQPLSDTILKTVSQKMGTPTFVYDLHVIEENYKKLRHVLTDSCDIYYSMKANPALAICEYIKILGAGCEVSSLNELLIAQHAGFLLTEIIFAGPGKNKREIQYAVEHSIKAIVCESLDEIACVNALSCYYKKKTPILIRINPDFLVLQSPIKMSGVASQFGIDLTQLDAFFNEISHYDAITVEGVQIYNASRVLDHAAIIDNIHQILKLSDHLAKKFAIEWKTIDVGGGFGIAYFDNEKNMDVDLLALGINHLLVNYKKAHPKTRFIIELGRYLVAESGYLILSVQSVKKNHNKNYIVVDAGFNCYFAASGLGSFVHRNFPMRWIQSKTNNHSSNHFETYHVAGPLCTPGDILLRDIPLSKVCNDDLIILLKVGAYGASASPGRFISHGFPEEVIYFKNKIQIIKRRETINELLITQYSFNPQGGHHV